MQKIAKNIGSLMNRILSQGLYLGLLVLGGTACAEADFSKSRGVSVLSIDIRDTSTEVVQFTLHDLTFQIPKNRLSTILEQLRTQPDKITDGFTMVGAGVEFAPKTEENIERFLETPSSNDLIRMSVRLFCREPDNTLNCSASEGMLREYNIFGKSSSFPDRFRESEVPAKHEIPSVPDMEYIGYSVDSMGSPRNFLYAERSGGNILRFAECRLQRNIEHYNCKFWIPWRDEYFLNLSIGEKYLPQYKKIYENALGELEGYVVAPNGDAIKGEKNVIYFPHKTRSMDKGTLEKTLGTHYYYFQLREKGDYSSAYGLLTERQKENVSLEEFSNHWRAVREKFGALTHLSNTKVTWYRNPEGAPEGLYAAIDFRASFERLPIYCGFLVWSIDEGYKIQREEMNFLENKSERPMTNEEKDKAYRELSCR